VTYDDDDDDDDDNDNKREVDHSLPSSAEVRNEWSYISAPCIRPHGVDWEQFILLTLC
jgi:hypothetical protein